MSATIGTGERGTICARPSAAAAWYIWASVASTSLVLVVVIDCTEIGAPPPMATSPMWIWRVFFRGESRLAEGSTHPLCLLPPAPVRQDPPDVRRVRRDGSWHRRGQPRALPEGVRHRVGDVEVQRGGDKEREHQHERVGDREELRGVRLVVGTTTARPDSFVEGDRHMSAVEGEHREHIEEPDEDVDGDEHLDERPRAGSRSLRRLPDGTDDRDR